MMTVTEIRAARMYIFGLETIDRIAADCRMTSQEVLHSIAVYKAEHRNIHPKCEHCQWRSGERPCVMPSAVCNIK